MSGSKKVLILGASGQLGASLLAIFGGLRSYKVVGLDHKGLDICDSARLAAVFAEQKPWAVINAAAWTDVDGCEKNVEKAYTVNAIAAGEVAQIAAGVGARVAHVSTDYVFDGFQELPYREDDEPDPLSIYGKSKLEGERLVREACADALIVRSSWLFGMGRSNFVMRLFESVMVKSEIPVVSDRRGSPTFTQDLAEAIEKLLAKDAKGLVHVTNQGDCSWCEYAQEILRLLNITTCKIVPILAKDFKRPAPRPAYSVLDNERYRGIVGTAMRPWQEALAEFLKSLHTDLNPTDVWTTGNTGT